MTITSFRPECQFTLRKEYIESGDSDQAYIDRLIEFNKKSRPLVFTDKYTQESIPELKAIKDEIDEIITALGVQS